MEGLHISNFLNIQSKKIQEYCTRDANSNEYKTILYFAVHTYRSLLAYIIHYNILHLAIEEAV